MHKWNGSTTQNQKKKPGDTIIDLRNVSKSFETPAGNFKALTNINTQVGQGEFIAVLGKSGSGKSTMLNLITGIDTPSSGEVFVAGTAVHKLNQNQLAIWRGKAVGVVFQFYQLLPTLTVLENVMLPMDFCNTYPRNDRKERAIQLLEQVDIVDQMDKLPTLLSGGQQQRAAIARALANDPPLLVADEPTGNLDSQTAHAILQLFTDMVSGGKTVVMVTHDPDVMQWVSRTVTLSDGQIANSVVSPENQEKLTGVLHA